MRCSVLCRGLTRVPDDDAQPRRSQSIAWHYLHLSRAIPARSRDLSFYVRAVARLGGYLDRAPHAPPGTTVLWRGPSRLADLVEGARIAETPPPETYG
jgi:hypothetical protein